MDIEPEAPETATPPVSRRRRSMRQSGRNARVLAFKVLYEVDIARHPAAEVFDRQVLDERAPDDEADAARTLVRGVLTTRAELDELMQRHAQSWPIEQLSAVERNILRIAIYELLHQRESVPVPVAINEAVELAKVFGGDAASRFVNGVLGHIVRTEESSSHTEESGSPGGEVS